MTEEQFRAAIRHQMDEYLRRLEVAYTFMIHNNSALIRAAQKDGVSKAAQATIICAENDRTAQQLDEIMSRVSAQAAPQSLH